MKLIIVNGMIVTPSSAFRADIVCENGKISSLEAQANRTTADECIDAEGLVVFPGFIDPHVHSRDPGLTEKEDFAHSTRAAAAGGVTTLLEMPNALPPVSTAAVFRERADQHTRVAFVDFGLWGISLGSDNIGDIAALINEGAVGIKLFWGYAHNRKTLQIVYNTADESPSNLIPPPSNGEVLELFAAVASAGGLLAAHCEDTSIVESAMNALGREVDNYEDFLSTRPEVAETAAVATAIEFARATGCRFHVVHASSVRTATLVREAQAAGIPVSAETCPQYLTLTDESYPAIGPSMKVYPPVRRTADLVGLWEAIRDGTITSVGSDHAPHTIAEKERGFATQPAGGVGVETLVRVMLNGAASHNLGIGRLAWILSEGTARLFDIYPQKGSIMPGADADLVLVDMDASWTIRNESLHSKNPLSSWNGMTGKGLPCRALVRGHTVMLDGEPTGDPTGRLVRPTGAHHPTQRDMAFKCDRMGLERRFSVGLTIHSSDP